MSWSKGSPIKFQNLAAHIFPRFRLDKTGKLASGIVFNDIAVASYAESVSDSFGGEGPEFAQVEHVDTSAFLAEDVHGFMDSSVSTAPAYQSCLCLLGAVLSWCADFLFE